MFALSISAIVVGTVFGAISVANPSPRWYIWALMALVAPLALIWLGGLYYGVDGGTAAFAGVGAALMALAVNLVPSRSH